MARFAGQIGYGHQVETPPNSGKWKNQITERTYSGDMVRESSSLVDEGEANSDLRLNNSISVVADAYAIEHASHIKYVKQLGVYWVVTEVTIQHPRLTLRLGRVYNGPKA